MAEIITSDDLPTALQSAELVDLMLAGVNAQASRVAPCLVAPTSTAWASATAYAVGDQVVLADGQYVEVTVAGTSAASAPTVPALLDGTVTDGTVTWKRITPTDGQLAEARLILVGAIKRWVEAGSGALQSQTVGPFGQTIDTRQRTGYKLWRSEEEQLQDICSTGTDASSGAFSITPACSDSAHLPWCALAFGATYCSCGVDIAGFPIYELGADAY